MQVPPDPVLLIISNAINNIFVTLNIRSILMILKLTFQFFEMEYSLPDSLFLHRI